MFSVYLFCAIVGGVLMLLSLLTGQGDFDSGDIGDLDASPDLDADLDTDTFTFWSELPFLSLRFWVFGGGMFGITGLILTATPGIPATPTLLKSDSFQGRSGVGLRALTPDLSNHLRTLYAQ